MYIEIVKKNTFRDFKLKLGTIYNVTNIFLDILP